MNSQSTSRNERAHAVYCSGYCALLIEINNSGDGAKVWWADTPEARPRWQEIKYNNAGDPYVVHYGMRYKLDLFIRRN